MGHARIISGLLLITLLAASPAKAGWHDFWGRVHLDWNRNNAWPEPFRYEDRQSVRATFAMQRAKGWRLETTLGAHHFDAKTNELTRAGEAKLYWILNYAPPANRMVFVAQTRDAEATQMRMQSVEKAASEILPDGSLPAVVRTVTPAPAARGDMIDHTWEQYKAKMPAPALPTDTSTGTGTGQ